MAEREKDPRIQALYEMGISPYSISRLNAIDGCLLEAYYTYKAHAPGKQNIYGIMGTRIHDVLEQIYNNRCNSDELITALENELMDADLAGVSFPKDFKGEDSIKNNWINDMKHFAEHFERLSGEGFKTEELTILKVSPTRYLIGYIDLIQVIDEETKTIDIYDFKTSSKFKKDDLLHHGRQLIVYGMAKEQEGYTVRNLAWIMLKYVQVTYMGYARKTAKNKTKITKIVQRSKLAKELTSLVEELLYQAKYGEIDSEIIISNFLEANDMNVLPAEIREQITVEQCIEYYPYTQELKDEALNYINTRADKFEALFDQPVEAWTPVTIDKGQSFYCNNLCSHRDKCPNLKKYNLSVELSQMDDADLF